MSNAVAKLLANEEISAGETIKCVVPTGNFGNILLPNFAKKMGLPIGKLICASNDNKVLYDFFRTGTYDRNPRIYADLFALDGHFNLQQLRAPDLFKYGL